MRVWIPEKCQIEQMLRDAADKLRTAGKVSDVSGELSDALTSLECHIYNRAGVEKGEIEE